MNKKWNSRLKQLLRKFPRGAIFFAAWLYKNGIAYELQRNYRDARRLLSISPGVMVRAGEKPTVYSAIACFNSQMDKYFHIGALSALKLTGAVPNMPIDQPQVMIYYPSGEWFPLWLTRQKFSSGIMKLSSKMLDNKLGILSALQGSFEVLISSPERAFLEAVHLAPGYYSLDDLRVILYQLPNLNPKLMQALLEQCKSIKTKSLFLDMAEQVAHPWFDKLDILKIDFEGKDREIVVDRHAKKSQRTN